MKWFNRQSRDVLRGNQEPVAWSCKCGLDVTDMVHTAERCYSTTEPVAAPVSVIVDRATDERHEYPQETATSEVDGVS